MPATDDPSPPVPLANGPLWAAMLAGGVGCLAMGVLTIASESVHALSTLLVFYRPSGDLSGKSTVAVVFWLIAWAFLHARWKNTTLRSPAAVAALTLALVGISLLCVFPPFFELLAPH
jgi:hypothetical protein